MSKITVIAATLLLSGSTALANPIVYELTGLITDAENLTFAVINGNLLSQNPQPSDLPLPFTGTFTVDTASSFAQLQIGGSFTSPTRAYTFDVTTPNVFDGLEVLALGGPVQFSDQFDDFDFSTAFSADSGFGQFSFVDPGVVPSSPAQDVSVTGSILSVVEVPSPGIATTGVLAVALASSRRRRA